MTWCDFSIRTLTRSIVILAAITLPLRANGEAPPPEIMGDTSVSRPVDDIERLDRFSAPDLPQSPGVFNNTPARSSRDDVERSQKFQAPGQPLTEGMSPFELSAFLIVDASQSLRGGRTTDRGAVRHLFEASLSAATEPLFGWSGGTLTATFQNQAGTDGSTLIGDLQVFSNIDADGRTQVSELWYEHVGEDTPWRVRIGKVDANTQFAFVEHGLEFLQSSMGFSPTIFVLPTYPDPAFSVNVFYEPDEGFFTGAGIYDGSLAQGVPTGSRGISRLLRGADVFVIGKMGWRWNAGNELEDGSASLPGRVSAGGWFHNGRFDRFDGTTQSGAGGLYLLLDQLIFRETLDPEDGQGLGVFAQYGYADPDVSDFEHHFGTGMTWTGPIPGRDLDSLGLGLSWAGLSQQPGAGFAEHFELSTELFYSVHAAEFATVVFDLQHIVNPSGRSDIPDALVGTLRLVLAY